MARREATPTDFLPLTPAITHILVALADGDRHGYAIMQEVERLTNGDERPDPVLDDERRRYYRATHLGIAVLDAETARMATLVSAARAKRIRAR